MFYYLPLNDPYLYKLFSICLSLQKKDRPWGTRFHGARMHLIPLNSFKDRMKKEAINNIINQRVLQELVSL